MTASPRSQNSRSRVTPEAELSPGVGGRGSSIVGVAIVSWNVRELLLRCLGSLGLERAGGTGGAGEPDRPARVDSSVPFEVVVVDNASADRSAEAVRSAFPDVTIIENEVNLGFTAGNNQAFRALGLRLGDEKASARKPPPFVLILNPDTEVVGDTLGTLIRHLASQPHAGAVGPLLRFPDGSVQSSRRRFPTILTALLEGTPAEWWWPNNPWARRYRMEDVPPDVACEVDWLNGAAILFRSEALAGVGGFDEGFFMYSEELDLCRRLRTAGWSTRFEPAAAVIHHEGRSSTQVAPTRHRLFMASRVRYVQKHYGRLAGLVVRTGLVVEHAFALGIEGAKWLVGHRRDFRAARIRTYGTVIIDQVTVRGVPVPGRSAGTAAPVGPLSDRFDA